MKSILITTFLICNSLAKSTSMLRSSTPDAVALTGDALKTSDDKIDTSFGSQMLGDNKSPVSDTGSDAGTVPPVEEGSATDLASDAAAKKLETTDKETAPVSDAGGRTCVSIDVKSASITGQIVAELDSTGAPNTVKNFMQYVDNGFYKGTIFHRVINNFMVQCGGFEKGLYSGKTEEKTGGLAAIKNEASPDRQNLKGTLSMARTSDPDSATSQFFISLVDNASLDGDDQNGYAVFGKVLVGMDQIEDIGKVATSNIGGMDDVPDSPIEIAGVAKIDCPP